MSVPRRDPSLQIVLLTLSIPAGKHGLSFRGRGPPVVSDVVAGSAAEQGGLRQGDFIIKVNNVDVSKQDADDVVPLLNQFGGRGLLVCAARPRPAPTTDIERRRALIAVQSKLDTKAIDTKLEQSRYASAVTGAQQSAQEILQTLKTSEDEPDGQQTVVLLELYDSDSLPSPPDSSGEDEEGEEGGGAPQVNSHDPLLDFSRIDSLTHVPGKWTDQEGQAESTQPPKLPPPAVGLPPSNAIASNRHGGGVGQGSSPAKSPIKGTQFSSPTSQSSAGGGRAHPPLTYTVSDITSSKASSDVILRQRKKDALAGVGGMVSSPQGPSQRPPVEVEVGDVMSLGVACRELPNCVRDWRSANVQVWLQQLNPILYSLYATDLANHDITGPSLLRLNEDRLTDMGITVQKHRYLLASSIAMLRVKQESLEIRELVGSEEVDPDDELEMTYL